MADVVALNGVVGAGKSTTAEALSALLADGGVPHATVDADALRRLWPAPTGDPFAEAFGLANLAAVAANAWAAGARRLIVATVIEDEDGRDRLRVAVGRGVVLVRLSADGSVVDARLRRRHAGDPAGLAWSLARRPELEAVLDASGVDDAVVRNDALDAAATALAVAEAAGWR